jgi:hypothetical protein
MSFSDFEGFTYMDPNKEFVGFTYVDPNNSTTHDDFTTFEDFTYVDPNKVFQGFTYLDSNKEVEYFTIAQVNKTEAHLRLGGGIGEEQAEDTRGEAEDMATTIHVG